MVFLWVFLPTVLIANIVLSVVSFKDESTRIKAKNYLLLFFSLFFYAWGGIYYLLIMVFSILINYFGGFFVASKEPVFRNKKLVLAVIIFLNLAMLFFFKYFNMLVVIIESFMNNDNGIRGIFSSMISMEGKGALGIKEIVLPIGISFFTFQAMSYVVDLYRGDAHLQTSLVNFAVYVSLFPQLIAGPIVRYNDIERQLTKRNDNIKSVFIGQRFFCYGMAKKVLIANTFAEIADSIWAMDTQSIGCSLAWLGALSYTIQIYYDFSGYSDMAIGLGHMFGFRFKKNFDYPYTSLSVQEFWRRWHISLSTWFKEYVYIPLGGNRKGLKRTCINIFIVFLLTGIWHGANFTFIAWGIFYAVLQIMERLFLGRILEKNRIKIFNRVYTLLAVIIGWVYFRSDTIFEANEFLRQMFSFDSAGNSVFTYLSFKVIILGVFAVFFSGFVQRPLMEFYMKIRNKTCVVVADYVFQLLVLLASIAMIVGGTYNPFIYFQF